MGPAATAPDPGDEGAPVTVVGLALPDGVERTVHVVPDDPPLVCDTSWHGALAVVERGTIGLEAPHGGRLTLVEGDSFCVELTGPVVVRSTGGTPAVLSTVRRRPAAARGGVTDESSARRQSTPHRKTDEEGTVGTRTIEKAIDVEAPRERVWDVLLDDATYRQWTAEFMAGSYADTDWQEGSTVRFLDPSGSGMLGRVVASRRPELVDIEYDGLVTDGVDDTASEAAGEYRGSKETYRLTETATGTHLAIAADMGEQYYDDMVAAWDRALAVVKALAEA